MRVVLALALAKRVVRRTMEGMLRVDFVLIVEVVICKKVKLCKLSNGMASEHQ
jgi:hypothetical protein